MGIGLPINSIKLIVKIHQNSWSLANTRLLHIEMSIGYTVATYSMKCYTCHCARRAVQLHHIFPVFKHAMQSVGMVVHMAQVGVGRVAASVFRHQSSQTDQS